LIQNNIIKIVHISQTKNVGFSKGIQRERMRKELIPAGIGQDTKILQIPCHVHPTVKEQQLPRA